MITAPLRVRAQSFTPGENDLSAVVVEPTSRSGTQTDWKKIAFVQCAAERRRYFLCIQHGPKNRIFLPDCC